MAEFSFHTFLLGKQARVIHEASPRYFQIGMVVNVQARLVGSICDRYYDLLFSDGMIVEGFDSEEIKFINPL